MFSIFITRNNCMIGKRIALFLMIMTCIAMFFASIPDAYGQTVEVTAAEQVAKTIQNKDLNYMVLFTACLSVAFSFYLVKVNMQLNKEQNALVEKMHDKQLQVQIEQIKNLKDLAEEVRNLTRK